MAESPETSDHTSVQERIREALAGPDLNTMQPPHLMPFAGNPREDMPKGLPFRLSDYPNLVDWTGRVLRDDKRGAIPEDLPPILARLPIEPQYWVHMAQHFESRFKGLIGAVYQLKAACQKLGYRRTPNLAVCTAFLT